MLLTRDNRKPHRGGKSDQLHVTAAPIPPAAATHHAGEMPHHCRPLPLRHAIPPAYLTEIPGLIEAEQFSVSINQPFVPFKQQVANSGGSPRKSSEGRAEPKGPAEAMVHTTARQLTNASQDPDPRLVHRISLNRHSTVHLLFLSEKYRGRGE